MGLLWIGTVLLGLIWLPLRLIVCPRCRFRPVRLRPSPLARVPRLTECPRCGHPSPEKRERSWREMLALVESTPGNYGSLGVAQAFWFPFTGAGLLLGSLWAWGNRAPRPGGHASAVMAILAGSAIVAAALVPSLDDARRRTLAGALGVTAALGVVLLAPSLG